MCSQISSKDIIKKYKETFWLEIKKNLNKITQKTNIEDNTNSILITESNFLKIGPTFGSFDPKNSYNKTYKEIVQSLITTIHPYKTNYEKIPKEKIQEIALSVKPIYTYVNLKHKPKFSPEIDPILNPIGIKAKIKEIEINDTPKIPEKVEKIINDEISAKEMIYELYNHKFDNYYLTKILNAGALGIKKRFIPTRNAITAIDDILGKKMIEEIKNYNTIDQFFIFENQFLHNYFIIVLGPGNWEYEQFEVWPTGSPWNNSYGYNHEHEFNQGRKKYAELQAGGYYAARFSVLKALKKMKKQARVLVIREIYNEYSIPVGVWQVRENVINAFNKTPKKFQNKNETIEYIKSKTKYKPTYLRESLFFKQKKLTDFF